MITKNATLKSKNKWWNKILFFRKWPLICQILLLINFLGATAVFIYQMITLLYATDNSFGSLTLNQTRYMVICLSYAANMINATCLILAATRKISNFYWGIVACVFLGILAYFESNTGSWITFWIIQIPMQIIGVFMWCKNSTNKYTVEPAHLKGYWYVVGALILIVAIGLFAWLESYRGFSKIWYPPNTWEPNRWGKYISDAAVLMLDIGAAILMIKRYREQYILWILVDIVCIILWCITLNIILIIMFTMALVSSAYGIYEWWIRPSLKLKKK